MTNIDLVETTRDARQHRSFSRGACTLDRHAIIESVMLGGRDSPLSYTLMDALSALTSKWRPTVFSRSKRSSLPVRAPIRTRYKPVFDNAVPICSYTPGASARASVVLMLENEKHAETRNAIRAALSDKEWSVRAAAVHAIIRVLMRTLTGTAQRKTPSKKVRCSVVKGVLPIE